jgi:hypothetical protein
VIAPHASSNFVEFWNEGTPFRDFGPHTHRKAPVEAQARFSEESCIPYFAGLRLLQHSRMTQAG